MSEHIKQSFDETRQTFGRFKGEKLDLAEQCLILTQEWSEKIGVEGLVTMGQDDAKEMCRKYVKKNLKTVYRSPLLFFVLSFVIEAILKHIIDSYFSSLYNRIG